MVLKQHIKYRIKANTRKQEFSPRCKSVPQNQKVRTERGVCVCVCLCMRVRHHFLYENHFLVLKAFEIVCGGSPLLESHPLYLCSFVNSVNILGAELLPSVFGQEKQL